jgi:hypothetical protein
MGKWAGRLVRFVMVLAVLSGLLYAGDWLILRIRVSHGTAYRVIQVNQLLATRSIFPQQGHPACWWLERHTSQWE